MQNKNVRKTSSIVGAEIVLLYPKIYPPAVAELKKIVRSVVAANSAGDAVSGVGRGYLGCSLNPGDRCFTMMMLQSRLKQTMKKMNGDNKDDTLSHF